MNNRAGAIAQIIGKQLFVQNDVAVSELDLLTIIVDFCRPSVDSGEIASSLLAAYGSISSIISINPTSLIKHPGVDASLVKLLKFSYLLVDNVIRNSLAQKDIISNSKELNDFLRLKLQNAQVEEFHVVFLTSANQFILCEMMFRGTIDFCQVSARQIIIRCLELNAGKIIFAHNHPRGLALPSQTDIKFTKSMSEILSQIGIELVDHVVVAGESTISLRRFGYMGEFSEAEISAAS